MVILSLLCFVALISYSYAGVLNHHLDSRDIIYDRCPNGTVRYTNSCYMVSHDFANWPEAVVYCEVYGGHLVRIESEAEQAFVAQHVKNILGHTTDKYFWMGGTDAVSEGEWYWSKIVQPIQYTHWTPGQPDNVNIHSSKHQDCLAMYGWNGLWDDGFCEDKHNFICEMDVRPGDSEIVG